MVNCAAFGCTNRSRKGIQMFQFPRDMKDIDRIRTWLAQVSRINRLGINRENYQKLKLCGAHFEEEQFKRTKKGNLRLKADAVPTIFVHRPPEPKTKKRGGRRTTPIPPAVHSDHTYYPIMHFDIEGESEGSHRRESEASTQTAAAPQPPQLKNKILSCKPSVLNKGNICKPFMVNSDSQTGLTDDGFSKVMVLPVPVPVPVYVPFPMNLYSQYAPEPVGFPIPVPMFLIGSNRSNRLYSNEELPPILDIPVGVPEPPCQPAIMDIELEFPIETLELMAHRRQRAHRSPSAGAWHHRPKRKGQGSRVSAAEKEPAATMASLGGGRVGQDEPPRLQNKYGVDAWRRWMQWRNVQPGTWPVVLKDDVLQCTTAELGFGLCRFICEVKRPNGRPYSPDSLFYLCLGIQQYLFENGRTENIFTDVFYGKFTMEITKLLKEFQPTITARGYVHSRVEEDHLWDCKQLGGSSPSVLLHTILFFCTKLFGLRTLAQHRRLSFGHVTRCTTYHNDGSESRCLRFYPPIPLEEQDAEGVAAMARREEGPEEESVLEMAENKENPLRCPVRLYAFYLSKCPEWATQRSDLFYLHPECSDGPLWFSSSPLDDATMETVLACILTIREIHLTA